MSGVGFKKLYQEAQFFKKEYDLDTTLFISVFLKWKEPNRDSFFTTPLLFKSANIKLNRKIELEYSVEYDEESSWTVNPILRHSFSRFYDLELPEEVDDIGEFLQLISEEMSTKNESISHHKELNDDESWQIIRLNAIGNFNYKKSLLGKDYDQIIERPSASVRSLIDNELIEPVEADYIQQILPLDFSQLKAVKLADKSDVVIQGPPGTGKSHTIVGLIGNYISQGKKVLFVSQKRSALEVVYERLKESGLESITAFLNTEKSEKKDFFSDLRSTWEVMSKPLDPTSEGAPLIEKGLLDFYQNGYQKVNDEMDMSYLNMIEQIVQSSYPIKEIESTGPVPSLKDWKKQLDFLKSLEEKVISEFRVKCLSQASFTLLNKGVFAERDPIIALDKRLNEMTVILQEIELLLEGHKLTSSIKEFTQLCLAASILQMVNRSQLNLLDLNSKSYKSFSNWAKKYQLLKAKVERAEIANSNWTNKPTKSEITELMDLLKNRPTSKGILGILKRPNEKLAHAFKGFDPHLTNIGKIQLLEELRTEWNLKAELDEIKIKLSHNFQIADPENEVQHILQLRNKLDSISQNTYVQLLERDDSFEIIQKLSEYHPKIQHLNNQARFIFHGESISNVKEGIELINRIKSQLNQIKNLTLDLQHYFMLPLSIRDFIINYPFEIKKLDAIILYRTLVDHTRFEDQFDRLSGTSLKNQLDSLQRQEEDSYNYQLKAILNRIHEDVQEIENLLATPASKLKGEAKEKKKHYKNFKRILVHEIAKKQRHMPLKQFTTQTWDLLSKMQPIWIMNPLSVSERFNCVSDMFDVVIFDEASQIPIEDAIPSIQRAKQVVVVGDEKQMPPTSFFTSHSGSFTLLDKANFVYNKVMLKWHYRSEHPALVNFSNRYFYENELLTLPPVDPSSPFEFHKVDGVFENGSNEKEANEIAAFIKTSGWKGQEYGVIAFSREQENAIRSALSMLKIKSEEVLISNLENVQGIERDNIIISVGYGPDPSGNFKLNFGPVNQEGGINRLNVLFTRAKKKMIVFSSVLAEDFGLSDNLGVSCLRDYIDYVREKSMVKIESNSSVNYSAANGSSIICQIDHNKSEVQLSDPSTNEEDSKDLKTSYSLLKQRFKNVSIKLTKDDLGI